MTIQPSHQNPFYALLKKYTTNAHLLNQAERDHLMTQASQADVIENLIQYSSMHNHSITTELSDLLNIPWVDLDSMQPGQLPLDIISEKLLRQYPLLPLWQHNKRLYIGMANPCLQNVIQAVRFQTGLAITALLVEPLKLEKWRHNLLNNNPEIPLQHLKTQPTNEAHLTDPHIDDIADQPLIRYVNQLLYTAVEKRASDIHFEPQSESLSIRFRIDGFLYTQPAPPKTLENRILARIKIMAALDIAERRLPQDGRLALTLPHHDQTIDCRISTCPTLHGEKIVVRLLNNQKQTLALSQLGLTTQQHDLFLKTLHQTQGMILVTGPTGSGKTVTLYSALSYLNQEKFNIVSAEDPVEINVEGINQVNIHSKIGLNFAQTLRLFLRQDPDIIMLGEIRDTETAKISVQAAQTGHLVLSTLHTNSAIETLTRLVNMDIPTYNIADSVSLIIAQRLARILCTHCKQPAQLDAEQLTARSITITDTLTIFKPTGCEQCTHGYHGRIGIFELLPITDILSKAIIEHQPTSVLIQITQQMGIMSLKQAAFEKLKDGIISLEEFDRIVS